VTQDIANFSNTSLANEKKSRAKTCTDPYQVPATPQTGANQLARWNSVQGNQQLELVTGILYSTVFACLPATL
jgi:hypothetical protein